MQIFDGVICLIGIFNCNITLHVMLIGIVDSCVASLVTKENMKYLLNCLQQANRDGIVSALSHIQVYNTDN